MSEDRDEPCLSSHFKGDVRLAGQSPAFAVIVDQNYRYMSATTQTLPDVLWESIPFLLHRDSTNAAFLALKLQDHMIEI